MIKCLYIHSVYASQTDKLGYDKREGKSTIVTKKEYI